MQWPLDIQYYSTPYQISLVQIQSYLSQTASKLQHYVRLKFTQFYYSYEECGSKNSRARILLALQLIQSCADRAHYPAIFFEKFNIIANEERLGQNSTSLVKNF